MEATDRELVVQCPAGVLPPRDCGGVVPITNHGHTLHLSSGDLQRSHDDLYLEGVGLTVDHGLEVYHDLRFASPRVRSMADITLPRLDPTTPRRPSTTNWGVYTERAPDVFVSAD